MPFIQSLKIFISHSFFLLFLYLSVIAPYGKHIDSKNIQLSNEQATKYYVKKKCENILISEEALIKGQVEEKRPLSYLNALLGVVSVLIIIVGLTHYIEWVPNEIYKHFQEFTQKQHDFRLYRIKWFDSNDNKLFVSLLSIIGHILKTMQHKFADTFSMTESEKRLVNPQPEDLVSLAREVIDSYQSLARQKCVTLTFSYPTCPVLNIERSQISTILSNLIDNALKFTPAGGALSLDWKLNFEKNTPFMIRVASTGFENSEEDLLSVLAHFDQAPFSGQTLIGRKELNLSLASKLANLYGGEITIGNNENKGITFIFSLPETLVMALKDDSSGAESYLKDTVSPNWIRKVNEGSNMTMILLIEDRLAMRQYIRALLRKDYQVVEASDTQMALELIAEFKPELIISDVRMSEMDGLTFVRKLKSQPMYQYVSFINLITRADFCKTPITLRAGIDDYLIKPFEDQELLIMIQNLLKNAGERKKAIPESLAFFQEESLRLNQEEKIVMELEKLVKKHLVDGDFSISTLTDYAAMSESSLSRLLKKVTGFTPGQFIRNVRLQEAAFFLETHQYTSISEVVYAVGFEDTSSFTRLFKKRFGKSPTEYLNEVVG